ncbi:hypothetical protein MHUMG1_10368 [Metarhizium humberi]|uniref:Transcription initiation factor IID, 18kDa subunit n=1 Tax=Metarhizium humberi TaxID=2596975 RepID=A0A9P8M1G6_9HYPO|nr:hypothetical protein MHUMG1_10368 [Metarhizium humberi]
MSTPPVFASEIRQMMYVAGETESASTEAVSLIESIIRNQVIHLITTADEYASRRGSRVFSNNDLIFQFRHDTARVERVQKFLALKALRRSSKADDEDVEKVDVEDADTMQGGLGDALETSRAVAASARLPWDINTLYGELPPGPADSAAYEEQDATNLEKLRAADAKTLNMTVAEYTTWSEYRHASFTRRRVVKFRQWCGLGVVADHKASDDVLDILGFLTSEMVHRLTVMALGLQERENRRRLVLYGEQNTEIGGFASLMGLNQDQQARLPVECRHIRHAYDMTQSASTAHGARRKGIRSTKMLCLI